MTQDSQNMSCAEFQELLPELIGSGEKIDAHPHMQSCPRCRALLADLKTIVETARRLFPIVEPPEDLWNQIESAIKEEESTCGKR